MSARHLAVICAHRVQRDLLSLEVQLGLSIELCRQRIVCLRDELLGAPAHLAEAHEHLHLMHERHRRMTELLVRYQVNAVPCGCPALTAHRALVTGPGHGQYGNAWSRICSRAACSRLSRTDACFRWCG